MNRPAGPAARLGRPAPQTGQPAQALPGAGRKHQWEGYTAHQSAPRIETLIQARPGRSGSDNAAAVEAMDDLDQIQLDQIFDWASQAPDPEDGTREAEACVSSGEPSSAQAAMALFLCQDYPVLSFRQEVEVLDVAASPPPGDEIAYVATLSKPVSFDPPLIWLDEMTALPRRASTDQQVPDHLSIAHFYEEEDAPRFSKTEAFFLDPLTAPEVSGVSLEERASSEMLGSLSVPTPLVAPHISVSPPPMPSYTFMLDEPNPFAEPEPVVVTGEPSGWPTTDGLARPFVAAYGPMMLRRRRCQVDPWQEDVEVALEDAQTEADSQDAAAEASGCTALQPSLAMSPDYRHLFAASPVTLGQWLQSQMSRLVVYVHGRFVWVSERQGEAESPASLMWVRESVLPAVWSQLTDWNDVLVRSVDELLEAVEAPLVPPVEGAGRCGLYDGSVDAGLDLELDLPGGLSLLQSDVRDLRGRFGAVLSQALLGRAPRPEPRPVSPMCLDLLFGSDSPCLGAVHCPTDLRQAVPDDGAPLLGGHEPRSYADPASPALASGSLECSAAARLPDFFPVERVVESHHAARFDSPAGVRLRQPRLTSLLMLPPPPVDSDFALVHVDATGEAHALAPGAPMSDDFEDLGVQLTVDMQDL